MAFQSHAGHTWGYKELSLEMLPFKTRKIVVRAQTVFQNNMLLINKT